MRVAQVCHRYLPSLGGIQFHVKEISERLFRNGLNLEILTTDPSGKLSKEEILDGLKVKRFKSFAPMGSFYFSRKLKGYLKENSNQYDVVHTHNFQALPVLYAAKAKDINRLIVTPHYHGHGQSFITNMLYYPYRFFLKEIFEKSDKIICVSEFEKTLIKNHFNPTCNKITIIPNGINLKEFIGLEKQEKKTQTILYVGRLEKYKGIHYLIMALKKLDKNVILEIIGKGSKKEELIRLTQKLNLRKRVIFRQDLSRKELLQSYVDADLFALLSKYEAFGITVMEALASKVPCLVANTSALREWIDNKNCFGINYPIDINELANRIISSLGKKVIDIKFTSWDEVAFKTEALYKSVLNN